MKDRQIWKLRIFTANKTKRESGQEVPQSQTANQPRNREEEPQSTNSHKTKTRLLKLSDQLSIAYQDDCKSRTQSTE